MEDNKIIILMDHTIHHNEHHAEDFVSIAKDLRDAGANEAAELAESAANDINEAVKKLVEARDLYKKQL
ncbi:MAG: hypothetical protein K5644_00380 [Lachnospiraceae bacterium]|nr:hypothetical protein [Lachnospiraceae bacterium]